MKYLFKEDFVPIKAAGKASAQRIGEALEKIAKAHAGGITPKAVVEAARDERHPLHRHFQWDDALAAEAYRLDQARTIIRCIRVEDGDNKPAAFHSINDRGGVSYRTHTDVMNSVSLQMLVLEQASRDLEAFESRYRELVDVCKLVRGARQKVQARASKLESRPSA